jgi:hypothetical protein
MAKRNASLQTVEEIILALPSASDLPKLREEFGNYQLPILNPGSHWGNSKIGQYSVTGTKKQITVTWTTVDGPQRTEKFQELISKKELDNLRLELGWMIANMLRVEAVRALQAIPDPNEAQKHWDFYKREEQRWRRWAVM